MKKVFEGIRVVDFTNNVAGPCATAMLADMGAEIIKIERPVAGDDSRGIAPRLEGQSLQFNWFNRGKKSVELSLKDPEAQEILKKMIADADVVVESFKPGQMKKFGLDYESVVKVNPQIIYCSVSACGQTGGYAKRPGFDVIAQGMSGFMDMQGDADGAPVKSGTAIGDYVGVLNAYSGIVTALYHKQLTGEGQHIDIALLDGLVSVMSPLENAATLGAHPTRSGRHHGTMAPYGIYRGINGQSVIIAAFTASQWTKLCGAMGMPELETDERFATNALRTKNINELESVIEGWLAKFENVDDAIKLMENAGAACCKIKSLHEVAQDPVLWERGTLIELPLPPSYKETRSIKARGPWIKYSKTPAEMLRAPDLGEHTNEILTAYGWTQEKIDAKESEWAGDFKKQ